MRVLFDAGFFLSIGFFLILIATKVEMNARTNLGPD